MNFLVRFDLLCDGCNCVFVCACSARCILQRLAKAQNLPKQCTMLFSASDGGRVILQRSNTIARARYFKRCKIGRLLEMLSLNPHSPSSPTCPLHTPQPS